MGSVKRCVTGFFSRHSLWGTEKNVIIFELSSNISHERGKINTTNVGIILAAHILILFCYIVWWIFHEVKSNQIDLTYLFHLSDDHVYSISFTATFRINLGGIHYFTRFRIQLRLPCKCPAHVVLTSIKVHSTVTIRLISDINTILLPIPINQFILLRILFS